MPPKRKQSAKNSAVETKQTAKKPKVTESSRKETASSTKATSVKKESPNKQKTSKKPKTASTKKKSASKSPPIIGNSLDLGKFEEVGDYTVARSFSGFYSCTCAAFKFKKGKIEQKTCKHMDELGLSNKDAAVEEKIPSSKKGKKGAKGAFKMTKLCTLSDDQRGEFAGKSLVDLKALLKKNQQVQGGSKPEILARLYFCIEYGRLPRCTKCAGGKMKQEGAMFKCPGYMDDDEFKFCGYRSDGADLQFIPFEL